MLENPARSKEVTSENCDHPESIGSREDRSPQHQAAIRGELNLIMNYVNMNMAEKCVTLTIMILPLSMATHYQTTVMRYEISVFLNNC